MSVKLRFKRMGRSNAAFFRLSAIDSRSPRDGRVIEELGHYNPREKDKAKQFVAQARSLQALAGRWRYSFWNCLLTIEESRPWTIRSSAFPVRVSLRLSLPAPAAAGAAPAAAPEKKEEATA